MVAIEAHTGGTQSTGMLSCYRPQMKFAKVVLHLSVSHSVHRGSTWVTPWAGTPPREVHPLGRYIPREGTPPGQVHPPGRYTPWAGTPPKQCMLGYGQ